MKKPSLAVLVLALVAVGIQSIALPAAAGGNYEIRLPLVFKPAAPACPATSGNAYAAGLAYQYDTDNPVRPAWNHFDKNLALRDYGSTNAHRGLVNYGPGDPTQPPQLATIFGPNRVPGFSSVYRVNEWFPATSPDPGTRGGPITDWEVTALGLQTNPGEALHTPVSGYDLGGGMEVLVMFADQDSITLKYTREDTAAIGYTLHIDNICTDPNLLALYTALDSGARYVYQGYPYSYNLPNLPAGQVFGTARGTEIRVAMVDSGAFMDPRSCDEWWQVRPGANC